MAEKPKAKKADIGGIDIEYLDYEGGGPALILLHATGFLPWIWHPVARELSDSYHVIAPYFCDHRIAELSKGGLAWSVLAEDLEKFRRKLGMEKPFVIGHSMGGGVATIACSLYGLDARGLMLIEPIFLPEELYRVPLSVEEHPLASKSIKRRNSWEDRAAAREYLLSRPFFAKWDEEVLDLYLAHGIVGGDAGGLTLACQPEREAALFLGGGHENPWPLMQKVDCPVLIVEGENSENRAFIDLAEASRHFPQARHVMVPDAGHLVPMEKPGETLRLAREFFEAIKQA